MPSIAEVEKLASDLPDSERAVLAARLLGSLPPVLDEEDGGIAEALRRAAEFDTYPRVGISLERIDELEEDAQTLTDADARADANFQMLDGSEADHSSC